MDEQVGPAVQKIQGYIDGFFWILPNLGIGLVVLLLFFAIAWAVRLVVINLFHRRHRDNLGQLLGDFSRWALILFGVLTVATIVFPSIRPADLLATLGIGSVAIGFAFKDILQNWLSGLLILYRQPFRPGDQIVSGGFEGTVEAVEARATLLRTYDGQRVVIPNSDIYTRAVVVRTAFSQRRSEYDVGIGYADDVDQACRVILDALRQVEDVARDPAPDAVPRGPGRVVRRHPGALVGQVAAARHRAGPRTGHRGDQAGPHRGRHRPAVLPTQVVLFHDQTEETDGDRSRQREGWPAGRNPPAPRRLEAMLMPNGQDEDAQASRPLHRSSRA